MFQRVVICTDMLQIVGRREVRNGRRLGVEAALVDGGWIAGDVVVDGGMVLAIGVSGRGGAGRRAVPGFVDLQVNGFAGVSFPACDDNGFERAAIAMAECGVTSFLPTIPTAAPDSYANSLVVAAAAIERPGAGARALGVHLEGPFLSPLRPGAHNPAWLRAPDVALAATMCETAPIAVMTLAPELDGAADLIAYLRTRGIRVSAGHSDATSAQAHIAFDQGVTMVTHIWNAQRQITSREPGLAGAALARSDVYVGIIADGIHLANDTLIVTMAAAGERAVVVTDAAAAAGLPDGEHAIGGRPVIVGGGAVRLPNGTLSGSAFGMDELVRNLVSCGVTLERAISAVTRAPAAALGRNDVGRLAVGERADVVVLDDNLSVSAVLVGGVAI